MSTPLTMLYGESVRQQDSFTSISWDKLCELVEAPPTVVGDYKHAKDHSPVISASSAQTKRKEDILQHDCMCLLRIDIDETELNCQSIRHALERNHIGSYIIHTTHSHQQEGKGRRYRVYIELAESMNVDTWVILEDYLAYLFDADSCASRPQQIMFLPGLFQGHKYRYYISTGEAFEWRNSDFLQFAIEHLLKIQEEQRQQALSAPPARQRTLQMLDGQISIIDCVNGGYTWEHVLTQYGYRKQGKAWINPESTTKKAGGHILTGQDGQERFYTFHSSDPCCTGYAIDIFDFLTIRGFNGDFTECLKYFTNEFPEVKKHNARIYYKQVECGVVV